MPASERCERAERWVVRAEMWLARGFQEAALKCARNALELTTKGPNRREGCAAADQRARVVLARASDVQQPDLRPMLMNEHQQEWNGHNLTFGGPNLKRPELDYIKAAAAQRASRLNRKLTSKDRFAGPEGNARAARTGKQGGEQ